MFSALAVGVMADSAVAPSDNMTIRQVEQITLDIVSDVRPDIVYGSQEYFDFLTQQFYKDTATEEIDESPYVDQIIFYANEYIYLVQEALVTNDELFAVPDYILDSTISELKQDAQARVTAQEAEINSILSTTPAVIRDASYNSSAAVAYAKQWAKRRNTNYNNHNLTGGDCTNFVSQALVAGGIPMTKPSNLYSLDNIYGTTNYWYCEMYYDLYAQLYKESSSFINVNDFYTYMRTKGLCTSTSGNNLSYLGNVVSIGDIVQLGKSNVFTHSIIITGYSNGEYTWSAHSSDYLDAPLSNIDTNKFNCYRVLKF